MSPSKRAPFQVTKFEEQNVGSVATDGIWRDDSIELKPCWSKPSSGDKSGINSIFAHCTLGNWVLLCHIIITSFFPFLSDRRDASN